MNPFDFTSATGERRLSDPTFGSICHQLSGETLTDTGLRLTLSVSFRVQGAQFEVSLGRAKRAFEIEYLHGSAVSQTGRRPASSSGEERIRPWFRRSFPEVLPIRAPGCAECSEAPPGRTRVDPTTRHQSFWVRHHRPDVAVVEGPRGSSPEWRGRFQALPTIGDRSLRDFLNGGSAPLELVQDRPAHPRRNCVQGKELILLHVTSFKSRCPSNAKEEFRPAHGKLRTFFGCHHQDPFGRPV